ncbi:unnamed protein product [Owenia fusiformis]|uniref:Transmembrane protein 129 n=1 Tax=Owenia fusiformis TaxID=6347 RepID=A0A8S4NX53_OWEFU|nr:unnamed protein product [Owenia fusiformis]
MASIEAIYTVLYFLLGGCIIFPPTEFVSAGLTIQHLLSGLLGSEEMNFIYYHIKRITATMIFHSFLPLFYFLGLAWTTSNVEIIFPQTINAWCFVLAVSVILPITTSLVGFYWSRNKWNNHPLAKKLSIFGQWRAVASSIDIEFRRIDKYTSGAHSRRLIATDSWILLTTTYDVQVAHQVDSHLTLIQTENHSLSHEAQVGGIQYLNISVESIDNRVPSFIIRLNATEYSDLKDKLTAPIRHAQDVIIRQSLSDRFLAAFREQVSENRPYPKPPDMDIDSCIGCMQVTANVKLQKLCDDAETGDCRQCYCRPMWCLECMGKWFASRQDQTQPERWMASKSPCPTCRAKFCLLDVCNVI